MTYMHRVTRSKKLLGAKGIATRNKDATRGAPGRTTRSKKLLGAKETSRVKTRVNTIYVF